jgi:cell division septation protein DedD
MTPPVTEAEETAEEMEEETFAPPEPNGYAAAPQPSLIEWPALPDEPVKLEPAPEVLPTAPAVAASSSNRGARIALTAIIVGAVAFAAWYFLGDLTKRGDQVSTTTSRPPQSGPVANRPNNSAVPAPAQSVNPATAPNTAPAQEKTPGSAEPKGASSAPATSTAKVTPPEAGQEQKGAVKPPAPAPPRETKPAAEVPLSGHSVKPGEGSLTIQVGSYNNLAEANARVAQLRLAGVEARVVKAEIPGRGTWYRLHAGRFTSRQEATRYATQLKAKGAVKDFLVTPFQATP